MKQLISIVVPAYNEEKVIEQCYQRLRGVCLAVKNYRFEIIFVNDGSADATQDFIDRIAEQDDSVVPVEFSRNFGKEIAMTAGLDYAKGDAVIIIDADLQDPPELIPNFIHEWENGFDIVYGKRTYREGESWAKKATASCFYKIINKLSDKVSIPEDTGDFRLMSRRSINALLKLREQHRFMKGLFSWIGFPTKAISYRRDPRAAGTTKFDYWKLWNFALEGITSFTISPLKIATYLGFCVALLSFCFGGWVIIKTLIWGEIVRGFPTLMVTILFLGGVQLIFIGVLGEYLGRIFNEVKQRPLYIVKNNPRSEQTPYS